MRNKNVDIIRSLALMLVVIYHIWVFAGSRYFNIGVMPFIACGGEIGVTVFFILSGFGIFYACKRMDDEGRLFFGQFLRKRLIRILPDYYIVLFIGLTMTTGAAYLTREHILNIVSHLFLVHNWWVNYAGAINGVLWTMGVTFQFYLLAIVFYKLIRRYREKFLLLSITLTIIIKYILFHYVAEIFHVEFLFYLSREVTISVLDNFIIGMYIANSLLLGEKKSKNFFNILGVILCLGLLLVFSTLGIKYGTHIDSMWGYSWNSIIAVCSGGCVFFVARMKTFKRNSVVRFLLWISNHEYGIYLVHLIVIQAVISNSMDIQRLLNDYYLIGFLIVFILSMSVGIIYSMLVNGFRKQYMFNSMTNKRLEKGI